MDEYQILIVDDDPRQLKMLTGHLIDSNPGLKLLIATNGKSGLEIAVRNKPDLILLDWEMPEMDGLEVVRRLNADETTHGIPVIMVTGVHNDVQKLTEALDAGALDFINKPYSGVELVARVKAQINHIAILRKNIAQQEQINTQARELAEKERAILKSEVRYHQKQLTMNTVNLLKQGHLLQTISDDIKRLVPHADEEGKKIIKSLILKINDKSSEHLWSEFEVTFEKVHSGFYNKLSEKIPDISLREKRLCAFLKMNMSTKEISSITLQSPNSIDVAKHRLRKKTGFASDDAFTTFLLNL
jgi:DNA-binding response OmpR family regulator/DNA-binding CsgD family transcriptional regulator